MVEHSGDLMGGDTSCALWLWWRRREQQFRMWVAQTLDFLPHRTRPVMGTKLRPEQGNPILDC